MQIYATCSLVFGFYAVSRGKERMQALFRSATGGQVAAGGLDPVQLTAQPWDRPNREVDPQKIEMAKRLELQKAASAPAVESKEHVAIATERQPSGGAPTSKDDESTETFAPSSSESADRQRLRELNQATSDSLASAEPQEQDGVDDEAEAAKTRRNNREAMVLLAGSVTMLLLMLLVVPAPNVFVSLVFIFIGVVLWFLAYVWFMDVLMVTPPFRFRCEFVVTRAIASAVPGWPSSLCLCCS